MISQASVDYLFFRIFQIKNAQKHQSMDAYAYVTLLKEGRNNHKSDSALFPNQEHLIERGKSR